MNQGPPLPELDQARSEKILKVLEPFLDTRDSRSAPDWAVEIYRLLAMEAPATTAAADASSDASSDARDAARWRRFAGSPQTALMLGSTRDPSAVGVDWKAECDLLADAAAGGA